MTEDLLAHKKELAVVGLGYVGLPLVLAFSKKLKVIGYDIDKTKIKALQNGVDPNKESKQFAINPERLLLTADAKHLARASFYIIAVPTPIDGFNQPDLKQLFAATATVARHLQIGDYVVFESTVYPGCTEEECIPILEKHSGLKAKKDFFIGYSPERINPGDTQHSLFNVTKIVSGCSKKSTSNISKLYQEVVKAGIFEAKSIKVAESAKILENTQRDINIALMNEMSIIFNRLDVNTYDVIEAAKTKWNFLNFSPGLVGRHCIAIDPFYIAHKAGQIGYHPKIINSGREVNENMPLYIARKLVKYLIAKIGDMHKAKVLIYGITYKPNIIDIKNSKVINLVKELQSFSIETHILDPLADINAAEKHEIKIQEKATGQYDAVILAVQHAAFGKLDTATFARQLNKNGVFIDLKGTYRNEAEQAFVSKNLKYWSL